MAPKPGPEWVLNDLIDDVLREQRINIMLNPLQGKEHHAPHKRERTEHSSEMDRLKEKIRKLEAASNSSGGGGGPRGGAKAKKQKGKGGGSAKGGGKRSETMPRELQGMDSHFNGQRICFDWNLAGCKKGINGVCNRGVHVCCKPNCHPTDHGFRNCKK